MSQRHSRLAALALVMLSACVTRGQNYHDRSMDFGAIKTVAVLPFQNLSRETSAADRVRDVFSTTLLTTESVYVLPQGEVLRGLARAGVANIATPSVEDIVKLGGTLKADAVITGVVKEYGETRSGNAIGNVVSMSVQMFETATGKLVWTAATTKGGVTFKDRLLGGGGEPLNNITEAAVDELIAKLFR